MTSTLKLSALLFLAATLPALAQSATPIAPDAQTVVSYYRMKAQQADDAVAVAFGQIATLQGQLAAANKEIAELQAKVAPPKDTPKTP